MEDVWPFVSVKVTANSSHGEEGRGTVWGTIVLQETGHVQAEVHRPGEVVWVCVYPANYLWRAKQGEKERKELKMELSQENRILPCWKPANPPKPETIASNRPQVPSVCASEATWRHLCFSALSNHGTILWLMVSMWGSHILSDWTKLLSLNYTDGV